MPIPPSGPISMSMFNVELGRAYNEPNSLLAGGLTPVPPSLFYSASLRGTIDTTAPHSMSEWYGYAADPFTSILQISYEADTFSALLSEAIYSTNITINATSLNVIGYDDSSCNSLSGETDFASNNLVITAGTLSDSEPGNFGFTTNTTYYTFSGQLEVNGTNRYDGEQFTIGNTIVTISFAQSCTPYFD